MSEIEAVIFGCTRRQRNQGEVPLKDLVGLYASKSRNVTLFYIIQSCSPSAVHRGRVHACLKKQASLEQETPHRDFSSRSAERAHSVGNTRLSADQAIRGGMSTEPGCCKTKEKKGHASGPNTSVQDSVDEETVQRTTVEVGIASPHSATVKERT